MRKKILSLFLALATSVGLMNAAVDDSGSCGDNVTYSFNGTTGEMVITGTGPMTVFSSGTAPWKNYKADITSVVVEDGVTSVSQYSFGQCTNLTTVVIGNDVETIGQFAFNDCGASFTSLTLGSSLKSVGMAAFLNAHGITTLTLPDGFETVGDYAFCRLEALQTLNIPSSVTSIGTSAFYRCYPLATINCAAVTPPSLGNDVFGDIANKSNIPLNVPNGSVAAYTAAAQWTDFDIQGYDPAPASTPSVTAARFLYNYDCQRSPAFPKVNNPCSLSGFQDPYEGYKGYRNGNIALGPWKLEFVAYYTPSNNYDCASQVSSAAYQYYSDLSYEEREAKKLEMPIFRLWQYNLTAQEYQPAAYGLVCAYAGEANAQDHGALFVSSNGMGCFLSGHQHTSSFALTCENDLTTGLEALVDAASAPSDPYYDVVWPVIVSIDAIGTVELSEHCKYYIEGSRAAYNALTVEQKAQVTNYSTLTDAETQWADLAAAAQPYADAVIDLINAIPDPVVYTQDCKDKIDAAQDAYDALTDGQKILVSNYETLKKAPSDLIKAAPYVHILFKANGNEKKVENVTLPREFTEAEMITMLKELYGVEGDYDMYAYSNSNADAVNISYEEWTIYPFMGEVNVHGNLDKFDPQTGYEWIDFSLEVSLELPPFGSAPASTDEQVPTNADPQNPSYYYSTFYHSSQNYALTNDGTTAFVADLSGNDLILTEIAKGSQVIPANTAVILRKSGSNEPVALAPTSEPGVSFEANNDLQGVDDATPVANVPGLTTTNCYVLSGTAQYGVGFYRINGTLLKAHKAYVKFSGSNGPKRMRFVFDTATGVESAQPSVIRSQKVLENGVIYIIKNGVKYNVQGQIVK